MTNTLKHEYGNPDLGAAIREAVEKYDELVTRLAMLQAMTKVPAFHATDEDDTDGVLERVQDIYDTIGLGRLTDDEYAQAFKGFDEGED